MLLLVLLFSLGVVLGEEIDLTLSRCPGSCSNNGVCKGTVDPRTSAVTKIFCVCSPKHFGETCKHKYDNLALYYLNKGTIDFPVCCEMDTSVPDFNTPPLFIDSNVKCAIDSRLSKNEQDPKCPKGEAQLVFLELPGKSSSPAKSSSPGKSSSPSRFSKFKDNIKSGFNKLVGKSDDSVPAPSKETECCVLCSPGSPKGRKLTKAKTKDSESAENNQPPCQVCGLTDTRGICCPICKSQYLLTK